ncbi:hypothetical protein V8E36_006897 [Tilletia maclaganii]
MAAYIVRMRENFYASAVGARPDPRIFDSWVWDEVVQTRQAVSEGRGASSSVPGSAGASSSRGDKGHSSKPFRKSTPSAGQGGGAICVICGRTRLDHTGDFASWSDPPRGKSKPHCKRVGPRRYLVRKLDNTSVCMAFNTSSCDRHSCRLHECLLCDAEGYERALQALGLLNTDGEVVEGMRSGFNFGIPPIRETHTLPNHLSARSAPDAVAEIAKKESSKGRWKGP